MNPLAPILSVLQKLGYKPDPATARALLILGVVLPLAIAGGLLAYVFWKKRKEAAAAAGPAAAVGAGGGEGEQMAANHLRKAWKRFEQQLPRVYRRSLLNFEHFVVLGAAASGKSRVIDVYSDWRRQAKQLPGSQSHDPDLPVYLASGAVITELPARYLTDHSARCQAALKGLWGPLYGGRAPTVIAVVDARWLRENSPEAVTELAESFRAKINLLSSLRGKPIDVRVALTFLDSIEGFADFAGFCREESLAARVSLALGEDAPEPQAQIASWFDAQLEQLPRALTRMASAEFLRVVAFLKKAPEVAPPLGKFLATLFAPESVSRRPLCGGVYLSMDPAGVASPTERAAERGPGPDPRRWHLLATAVVASSCMAFLYSSYRNQRDLYRPAQQALSVYDASVPGTDAERASRAAISDFAYKQRGWFDTHPDYFAEARADLRKRFSKRLRDDMLVPRLKQVAQRGTTADSNLALPTRRSLYLLSVLHSDESDRIGILDPGHIEVWAQMTGLSQDIIRDYLRSTDDAWKIPVNFDLNDSDADVRLNWQIWTQFLRDADDAINAGTIKPEDLRDLQSRAARLALALERYENDNQTVKLLDQLDLAAGTGAGREGPPPLRQSYQTKYADYLASADAYKVLENRERLKTVLRVVRAGAVDAQSPYLLRSLTDRLSALYEGSGLQIDEEPVKISMARQDYTFDPKRWRALLRDSTGRELILQFIRAASTAPSIFFGPEQDTELRAVFWNPTNDGTSIFVGKGTLDKHYTKVAYDNHVRAVILRLAEAMDKAKVPDDQKRKLNDFITERVRRYAAEYRSQVLAFIQSYGLRASSSETLRVALTQMSKGDASAFNDYLTVVDQNTRLDFNQDLLRPMETAVFDFTAWHNIVGGDSGAPEINKYRAILTQLLTDLGPEGAAPGADAQGARTLETDLTPPGRLVLTEVKGEKGSYAQLSSEWLQSVRLPEYQRYPFIAPFHELTRLGRRDIEGVLARVWNDELLPEVRRVAGRFPFEPTAAEDVSPGELTNLLHPQTGRYFDVFRRYFEPISDFSNGPFRPKPSTRGRLSTPAHFYELTNGVASLAARLWDTNGKPVPVPVRVATVPFEHGRNPRLALTLVYLNVGPGSLFNFNQKPAQVTMQIDWTKETNSQVGLQLTDIDTKENIFVEPIRTESSFWSLLRLQLKGQGEAAKYPPGAQLYSWPFKIVREGTETMQAQFVVLDDLWSLFSLGTFVRVKLNTTPTTASR